MQKITPFLMFDGKAELAMTFYASLFADSKIIDIERYGPEGPGVEGSVMHATISLAGQQVICIDSPVPQPFGLTPAFSLFVNCDSVEEITRLAGALAGGGGEVFMPLDTYPFASQFTWLADRFSVSWQLSLG
jgi:predicted 3-demethylubiquinone-9 3-methyltransferase (glyoxalase superfamily)